METLLSPAKVLVLAAHYAAHSDFDGLAYLSSRYRAILRKELLLRIILTYTPETLPPSRYVDFLKQLDDETIHDSTTPAPDVGPVEALSDEQASRKAKKLHLLQLDGGENPLDKERDAFELFLIRRAYQIDEEAGLLSQVKELLLPFVEKHHRIKDWLVSTVLPLLRRSFEYHANAASPLSLRAFEKLSDASAVEFLLAPIVDQDLDSAHVGRDLRGALAPWLHGSARWQHNQRDDAPAGDDAPRSISCSGWEQVREWLTLQAVQSRLTVVKVFESWDGPQDADLDGMATISHSEARAQYLQSGYAQTAMACAYLMTEPGVAALSGTCTILNRVKNLQNIGRTLDLATALKSPPGISIPETLLDARSAGHMRNDLLRTSNSLTRPNEQAVRLLDALLLSAYILAHFDVPCTVRAAGDMAFLQDRRDQRADFSKLLRSISSRAPRNDESHWIRARRLLFWLRDWSQFSESRSDSPGIGVFGSLSLDHMDSEFLKTLLSNSCYPLARNIYEDGEQHYLSQSRIEDCVRHSALSAYDNATNPNRTRGGLKRCDEIIRALPKTIDPSNPLRKQIEALLKATHALSEYRLVLKQEELFSPVVLRVHSDPISIIQKVLDQNPRAYTRFQEFLEMGINMIEAGLPSGLKHAQSESKPGDKDADTHILMIEKRIVAMCIETALKEDDFETAYSYVVSRLDPSSMSQDDGPLHFSDEWSWSAALKAGQYVRTDKSQLPTHLGTASGNLEIRHLEQRGECLATALRIAPRSQLQEILKTFRRCEEQLDSAIKEEAAKEEAWDNAGDMSELPGAFDAPDPTRAYPPRNQTASGAARQAEDAPMSLFDLSRATARVAQRNLTALSSLPGLAQGVGPQQSPNGTVAMDEQRVRKRDQLRDAATGTLVSGVGWLIGANVNRDSE